MCGIYGVIHPEAEVIHQDQIFKLSRALHHRGPDEEGYFHSGNILLGMTRLSIIDVQGGHQPIFNESKTILIICNGEIYNYRELRDDLLRRGHLFSTHSDVEVILHLYEEIGEKAFSLINGMFAVCIYEIESKRIVLARDAFGQKPLYYSYSKDAVFSFASELKAFSHIGKIKKSINYRAFSLYLKHRYINHPHTPFEDINKLNPGQYLIFENDKIHSESFFSPYEYMLMPRGREKIYDLLDASVERHMLSERPVGLFLSGGVDSNVLLHHMKKYQPDGVHTFSVGFENFADDELDNARLGASFSKSIHHELKLTPNTFWDLLDEVIYYLDEPMADLTTVPLYALAKMARNYVAVVLSGEGADELFGGYKGIEKRLNTVSKKRANLHIKGLLEHLPLKLARPMSKIFGSGDDYLYFYPFFLTNIFSSSDFIDLHKLEDISGISFEENYRQYFVSDYVRIPEGNKWKSLLSYPIAYWLPNDLLLKADRMTMAHSIEIRSPFLDMELAKFAFTLGINDIVGVSKNSNKLERKLILKDAYAGKLPDQIIYQQKKGFVIPAYQWLEGPLKSNVEAEVANLHGLLSPFIFKDKFKRSVERAFSGNYRDQELLWSIIVLNKWLKIHF